MQPKENTVFVYCDSWQGYTSSFIIEAKILLIFHTTFINTNLVCSCHSNMLAHSGDALDATHEI